MSRGTYLERLAARSAATGTVLCLGLDPHPDGLPPGFARDLSGIERFACLIVEAAAPYAAAIKPNMAFFEAFGAEGLRALERIRSSLPDDLPLVLDVKRGDMQTTSERHAVALFDVLRGDAITVNPYQGSDALRPLVERLDRFAYVLARTSNPGASEFQGLEVASDPASGAPAEPLYARVARRVQEWGPGGTIGLVVGATAPQELAAIRAIAPGLAFLVPGVGAQGGEIGPVLEHGPASAPPVSQRAGKGLLVNVSRAIAGAALDPTTPGQPSDPGERIASAAREWAAKLRVLR